jgi:hypothetical protein
MTTTKAFMGKLIIVRGPKLEDRRNVYHVYVDHRQLNTAEPGRSRTQAVELAKIAIAKGEI